MLTSYSNQKLATWCVLVPYWVKSYGRTPFAITSFPMCHISASEFVTSLFGIIFMNVTNSSDNVTFLTLEVHRFVPVVYIERPYRKFKIWWISNGFTNHLPFSFFNVVNFTDHLSYWIKMSNTFLCSEDSFSALVNTRQNSSWLQKRQRRSSDPINHSCWNFLAKIVKQEISIVDIW